MVGPYPLRLLRVLVVVLAAGVLVGCRSESKPTLVDLTAVDDLKTRFNDDAGKPRTVLLLSPT